MEKLDDHTESVSVTERKKVAPLVRSKTFCKRIPSPNLCTMSVVSKDKIFESSQDDLWQLNTASENDKEQA